MTDARSPFARRLSLPPRTGWRVDFPDIIIHTTVSLRDAHPSYSKAKAANATAALLLAQDLLSPASIAELKRIVGADGAILLPVTALEMTGFNAIPDAMSNILSKTLGWPISVGDVVQNNRVGHTRALAFNRLVTPAAFEGRIIKNADYVLVDDHVGLGGTLANLKGHIESAGGHVVAMTTLTESREARRIALQSDVLDMLRTHHGEGLENLWKEQFGHGLDCLTNVEGGILCREQTLESIRNRLAQAAIEVRRRGLDPGF
jgi:hypothetical protein